MTRDRTRTSGIGGGALATLTRVEHSSKERIAIGRLATRVDTSRWLAVVDRVRRDADTPEWRAIVARLEPAAETPQHRAVRERLDSVMAERVDAAADRSVPPEVVAAAERARRAFNDAFARHSESD